MFRHIVNLVVKNNIIDLSNQLVQAIKQFEDPETKSGSIYKLRQEVATRWNSTYLMLESVYKNHVAIKHVLGKEINAKYKDQILKINEIMMIEDLLELLKPFLHITKLLSGSSYVTCSVIYPIVTRISDILMIYESTHGFSFLDEMANEMYNDLTDRCEVYLQDDLIIAAAFLDQRYKNFHFIKDDEKRELLLLRAKNFVKQVYLEKIYKESAIKNLEPVKKNKKNESSFLSA